MVNLKNIEVRDIPFSIENLENLLKNYKPGSYKISWYTTDSVWDMYLKYNGKEFIDLRHKLIST